jgi:hypothetical protein
MTTALLSSSVIAPAELRAATEAMSVPTPTEASKCAHVLIDSITAIMIATEAKRRLSTNPQPQLEEARRMLDLIKSEHERATVSAGRLRTWLSATDPSRRS